mmetsp:Transcript_8993/g.12787  ORF Transcript_8993/g.12787 Transcript_8993/m.12787 type:complete len:230 (+) Transcript_8993:4155-4844(+)
MAEKSKAPPEATRGVPISCLGSSGIVPKAEKSVAGASSGSSQSSSGLSASGARCPPRRSSGGGNATPRCQRPPPPPMAGPDVRRTTSPPRPPTLPPMAGGPPPTVPFKLRRSLTAAAQISSASKVSQHTGSCGSLDRILVPSKCCKAAGNEDDGCGRIDNNRSRVNRIIFLSLSIASFKCANLPPPSTAPPPLLLPSADALRPPTPPPDPAGGARAAKSANDRPVGLGR